MGKGILLTQDPIGLAGGVNLYAYAGNNPIAWSDPFGLRVECKDEKACQLWEEMQRDAAGALRSNDESVRKAGKALVAILNRLVQSKKVYSIETGSLSVAERRLVGGGFTHGTPDGNERSKLDPDYYARSAGSSPVVLLAHEVGHADSDMRGVTADDANDAAAIDAENHYRMILGGGRCAPRQNHYSHGAPCK